MDMILGASSVPRKSAFQVYNKRNIGIADDRSSETLQQTVPNTSCLVDRKVPPDTDSLIRISEHGEIDIGKVSKLSGRKFDRKKINNAKASAEAEIIKDESKKEGFTTNLKRTVCEFFKKSHKNRKLKNGNVGIDNRTDIENLKMISGGSSGSETENKIEIVPESAPELVETCDDVTGGSSGSEDKAEQSENYYAEIERRRLAVVRNIDQAKSHGWYWGPLSSGDAEELLEDEPDGSFLIRDSSDVHHVFSLSFKISGFVRHARIEHINGRYSFGARKTFHCESIVEFVENAIAHSKSGRYLFFVHSLHTVEDFDSDQEEDHYQFPVDEIPIPLQVQLLYPLSRFRPVPSLQHLCRFVIVKEVRKDLIDKLPLPPLLIDYLLDSHLLYLEKDRQPAKTPSPTAFFHRESLLMPTTAEVLAFANQAFPL